MTVSINVSLHHLTAEDLVSASVYPGDDDLVKATIGYGLYLYWDSLAAFEAWADRLCELVCAAAERAGVKAPFVRPEAVEAVAPVCDHCGEPVEVSRTSDGTPHWKHGSGYWHCFAAGIRPATVNGSDLTPEAVTS